MIEGVIREEHDDTNRAVAAFLGCPRPQNPPTEASLAPNHFFDVQRGGRGLTVVGGREQGIPAGTGPWVVAAGGTGPKENRFSLLDARDYQYKSLTAPAKVTRDENTALLFNVLGQVLHLLEDMAQPQHTRNDPHAGCAAITS